MGDGDRWIGLFAVTSNNDHANYPLAGWHERDLRELEADNPDENGRCVVMDRSDRDRWVDRSVHGAQPRGICGGSEQSASMVRSGSEMSAASSGQRGTDATHEAWVDALRAEQDGRVRRPSSRAAGGFAMRSRWKANDSPRRTGEGGLAHPSRAPRRRAWCASDEVGIEGGTARRASSSKDWACVTCSIGSGRDVRESPSVTRLCDMQRRGARRRRTHEDRAALVREVHRERRRGRRTRPRRSPP